MNKSEYVFQKVGMAVPADEVPVFIKALLKGNEGWPVPGLESSLKSFSTNGNPSEIFSSKEIIGKLPGAADYYAQRLDDIVGTAYADEFYLAKKEGRFPRFLEGSTSTRNKDLEEFRRRFNGPRTYKASDGSTKDILGLNTSSSYVKYYEGEVQERQNMIDLLSTSSDPKVQNFVKLLKHKNDISKNLISKFVQDISNYGAKEVDNYQRKKLVKAFYKKFPETELY